MAGTVTMGYTITKEAMKLIKAGKAVLSSGGVRDLAGEFIELARPVASSVLKSSSLAMNPKLSIVNIASSLGANVQCGFIQHGVNIANAKLDNVLTQLTALTKATSALKQINVLSWVNTAFSLANCGISIAGLMMTIKRLDGVSGQLQELIDRYKQDRESDKIEKFESVVEFAGFVQWFVEALAWNVDGFPGGWVFLPAAGDGDRCVAG